MADMYAMSDEAVCRMVGTRLKELRLRRNITQEALAEVTLLSVGTIKSLEKGQGKLLNLVAVLRELGALENVEALLPPPRPSPLEMAKRQGRQRKHASGRGRSPDRSDDGVGW